MSFHWEFQDRLSEYGVSASSAVGQARGRSIELRRIEIGGEPRRVLIRLVENEAKNRGARHLVNARYSWRGYGSNHRIPTDDAHMTFTAEVEGDVVGTITLAVDTPGGLAVDAAFKNEVDEVRRSPGNRICELTKFAFDPSIKSKEVMAALFHIVFVYGQRTHGSTDLFIEVNPRHVRFYETMLGFARVGDVRVNDSVAAPAHLMWLKVEAIRDFINESRAGATPFGSRSLYPYFFSPRDETGIFERLAHAETTSLDSVPM